MFRAYRPILRRIQTAGHTTICSVAVPFWLRALHSPEEWPVGPKHVEMRRYMNKIEIVTSVGFSIHMLQRCTVQKA
jgi:hypothetical protein